MENYLWNIFLLFTVKGVHGELCLEYLSSVYSERSTWRTMFGISFFCLQLKEYMENYVWNIFLLFTVKGVHGELCLEYLPSVYS